MVLKFSGDGVERSSSAIFNNMANAYQNAVKSGCLVSFVSGLGVSVASGVVFFASSDVTVTSQNLTLDANVSSNKRTDLIAVNSSGTASIIKGTPSLLYAPPDYDPTNYVVLAQILLDGNATVLLGANIRDIRVINIGAGASGTTFTGLTDTPSSYVGQGGKVVQVKADVSGLEFGTSPGEANTASNVGTGEGSVYKQKVGVDLELKTIKAGTNITITNNTSDITITGPAVTSNLVLTPSPTSDHTGNGVIATYTAGENLSLPNVCYLKSDGKMWWAKADAEATASGKLVLATANITANATGVCLDYGYFRDDTWNWTVGGKLYLSAASGAALTQTAPTTAGQIVRIVGYAYSADIIFFNPENTYLEI